MNKVSNIDLARYLWSHLRRFPFAILSYALDPINRIIFTFNLSYVISLAVEIAPKSDGTILYFWKPFLVLIGGYVFCMLAYLLEEWAVNQVMTPEMRKNIATESTEILLKRSHYYYLNNMSGEISNKVSELINAVPRLIGMIFTQIISFVLSMCGIMIPLYRSSPKIGIAFAIWFIYYMTTTIYFAGKIQKCSHIQYGKLFGNIGILNDIISNIFTVRLFVGGSYEKANINRKFKESSDAERKAKIVECWSWMLMWAGIIAINFYCFLALLIDYNNGIIKFSTVTLVMTMIGSLPFSLYIFSYLLNHIIDSTSKVKGALTIIYDKEEKELNTQKLNVTSGEIVLDKVSFSYNEKQLFNNLSVTISGGQKVGLVGYSGSGKTSFVNLILRLYDIQSGNIFIDGQNIADVTKDSIRSNISLVSQNPSLLSRSLLENIKYGKHDATKEEVIEASQKAKADEFINNLPEQYETQVGENGAMLSGGQRQRIALARAILKDSPIMILDESTSQIDSITEEEIQKNLISEIKNKTTLVIAHRLSTISMLDRILVFENGRIVEDGKHEELLLEDNGLYKKLWDTQTNVFIEDASLDSNNSIVG